MIYTQAQWLLFFFFYCFVGWIWECMYVSIRKREWVNRGFLYGPLLPIYGFGAIIVLWLTLPVRNNIPLIFLFGMIGATILEYITGAVMERTFHVRYWDYSDQKFNVHGHICLFCSLGWGLFSVILVRFVHLPVEDFVLKIPANIANLLSLILTVGFTIDTTKSVQTALDVRELLKELSENNTVISSLEEKLETVAANINESSERFRTRIQEIEEETAESRRLLKQRNELLSESYQTYLLDRLNERKARKSHILSLLKSKTEAFITEISDLVESGISENEQVKLSLYKKELAELHENLERIELSVKSRKTKDYKKVASIIRRNPSATSVKFSESFHELKQFYTFRRKGDMK